VVPVILFFGPIAIHQIRQSSRDVYNPRTLDNPANKFFEILNIRFWVAVQAPYILDGTCSRCHCSCRWARDS